MAYYETSYSELQQLAKELDEKMSNLNIAVLKVMEPFKDADEFPEDIEELFNRTIDTGDVRSKLYKHLELEVKGFEDLDTHFGKKLAQRVGKLQLIFQELAEIQRNMHGERDGSAEDRLLDQLEMDNMRWCEEVSEILKNWYNRKNDWSAVPTAE